MPFIWITLDISRSLNMRSSCIDYRCSRTTGLGASDKTFKVIYIYIYILGARRCLVRTVISSIANDPACLVFCGCRVVYVVESGSDGSFTEIKPRVVALIMPEI